MNKNRLKYKAGFTLIELVLAMGFVSVLLIAITMTVIQIANIYNRGMTLKDTNQAGRALASELQKSINGSLAFDISNPNSSTSRLQTQPWGGRLCIGQYSYIWNYGVDIKNGTIGRNVYSDSTNEIRFIKALDPKSTYCTNTLKKVVFADAVELMSVSEHDLAVHGFTIATDNLAYDSKTEQRLYNINFQIGTNNQAALKSDPNPIVAGAKTCKLPNEPDSDPAYCSVSQFSITARAGSNATE
jgi:type II secretory pathway pseudopilin PulG